MDYQLLTILLVFVGIFTCPVAVDITDIDDYDPGTCDSTNVLQVVSLKDRNDEKKLWICNKENGNYLWKPVDGNADNLGEFLQPARDCTDVLNHEQDVDDGFYWVKFCIKCDKRRVFCDMKMDGGGYMLVARKHDAETWSVPSKDQTVEPDSKDTYWSSQFGDAPISDFMIQFSTSDSFQDTKAHWSYRFKNKRPLGQLLITDRGCEALSPGIGDIAYVKDLMTEKIVTTTFKCAQFGHPHSSTLGWAMMNECLKKPCTGSGYFHHNGKAVFDLDHTGVFSYSATGNISGVNTDATAYIGCVNKKCCGCFGPVRGKGNYCNSQCSTANGGTIIDSDKLYTWVWVRSTLPKRIWDRCMEYQSPDENGQLEWYNLVGDSVIPQKGRCSNAGELRINSGVVVVPDSTAAKKVPEISGLLEFREDQKKLYLRANKTWNLLTPEKEEKGKLKQLEEKINGSFAKLRKKLALMLPQFNKYDEIVKVINNHPECTSYRWLNDSSRNIDYYKQYYGSCDSGLSTAWYRFGGRAGTRMSTSCKERYYCSTDRPGYLNGDHPALHEGIVSRTVYFFNSGRCNYYGETIKVLNCGLYYVYKLHALTNYCNQRYCGSF